MGFGVSLGHKEELLNCDGFIQTDTVRCRQICSRTVYSVQYK